VTGDEQVVYINVTGTTTASLEAIPLAGGTKSVIAAAYDVQADDVMVSGGAVAWWTGLDATTGVGTINVWTKATGPKTALNAASQDGVFTATVDGSRIAYSVAVGLSNAKAITDIAVQDSPDYVAVSDGLFVANDSVNVDAAFSAGGGAPPLCGLQMRFVGKKLLAAFCVAANDTNARLYLVPEASTTEVRLDSAGTAAGAIQPFWLADAAGTTFFTVSPGTNNLGTGRIIKVDATATTITSIALEANTARAGFVSDDGSAVLYRTTAGVRRTATAAVAPKTIVADAKSILGTASDKSRILVRKLDPASGLVDILSADTTTENQTPKDIVATAAARPFGFTGANDRVVYLSDVTATTNKLQSQPAAGGTPKEIAKDISGVALAPTGEGVIVIENMQMQGQLELFDLRYIDAVSGDTSGKITDGVPASNFVVTKTKKLVYNRLAAMGGGIFVADLP
jgi:hypothetical protein